MRGVIDSDHQLCRSGAAAKYHHNRQQPRKRRELYTQRQPIVSSTGSQQVADVAGPITYASSPTPSQLYSILSSPSLDCRSNANI